MKEKMLAFLLAAAMLAVLAGCGGGNAGEGAPTADGQKAGADRKDDREKAAAITRASILRWMSTGKSIS